jgi:hypothetical protein
MIEWQPLHARDAPVGFFAAAIFMRVTPLAPLEIDPVLRCIESGQEVEISGPARIKRGNEGR